MVLEMPVAHPIVNGVFSAGLTQQFLQLTVVAPGCLQSRQDFLCPCCSASPEGAGM